MAPLNKIAVLICILQVAFSQEIDIFPRPLIIEFDEVQHHRSVELDLECTSWRVAAEANNLGAWKTIPEECRNYVREYMTGKGYEADLRRVSNEALMYAASLNLSGDAKIAWIFDVDETLLSNLPYYADHGYGLEVFDSSKFDEWVETGRAAAIDSSLKLYQEVLRLGIKAILLTGRSQRHRNVTVENLFRAGFGDWEALILRSAEDHGKTATRFKSEKRRELVEEGYQIAGNSGDQWSDLLNSSMAVRSFKLPNPMYYIA